MSPKSSKSEKPAGKVRVKNAALLLDISVQEVLRLARSTDGTEHSFVVLSDIQTARDRESAAIAQATTSSSPRVRQAARKRIDRSTARVRLNFSLEPADRKTLEDVQRRVDELRSRVAIELQPGWKPDRAKMGSEPGTMAYYLPSGALVDNVPAADYMKMNNGSLPWLIPAPEIRTPELKHLAKQIAELGFQAKSCRLCGLLIALGQGPELAQIRQLLAGRFVLPYINHNLEKCQTELRFRRMHLICSIWEDKLVDVQLMLPQATSVQIADELLKAGFIVLKQAQRKLPSVTEDEVFQTLDIALASWEHDQEGS